MMQENDEIKVGLVPFSEYVYTDISTTNIRGVHPDKQYNTVTACLNSRRYPYATQETTPLPNLDDSKWSAPGMSSAWTQPGALSGGMSVNEEVVDCKDLTKIEENKCKVTESDAKDQCKVDETVEKDRCGLIADKDNREYCEDAAKDAKDLCEDNTKSAKKVCENKAEALKDLDQCFNSTNGGFGTGVASEIAQSDFADDNAQCADYRNRGVRILPLTTDRQAIINQLNSMTPIKMTNIALALEFGWHLVSPNEPFADVKEYDAPDNVKAIVLLTDGKQTVGGYGPGNSFNNAQADQNTEALCEGIKDKGVIVFTVAFDLQNNGAVKQMLKNCASAPDYFLEADGNAQLSSAFEAIVGKLGRQVHLSK